MLHHRLRAAAGDQGGAAGDPYWANVVALIYPSGADGSTTFIDETGLRTWARFGNAQVDTANVPFAGTGAVLLDGSGDYISTPSTADFSFSSDDYTIEGFLYIPGSIKSVYTVLSNRPNGDLNFTVEGVSGGRLNAYAFNTANAVVLDVGIAPLGGVTSNTWHHWALVRQAGTWTGYFNGVASTEGPVAETGTISNTGETLKIGRQTSFTSRDFSGSQSQIRITKGVSRYTSNFTPPTAPFPNF